MAGRFAKKCGASFKHQELLVADGHAVKIRHNMPCESLCTLDKLVIWKDKKYEATGSYCDGYVEFVKNYCTECGKGKSAAVHKETQIEGLASTELKIDAESHTELRIDAESQTELRIDAESHTELLYGRLRECHNKIT